jgi:hypothetical protein
MAVSKQLLAGGEGAITRAVSLDDDEEVGGVVLRVQWHAASRVVKSSTSGVEGEAEGGRHQLATRSFEQSSLRSIGHSVGRDSVTTQSQSSLASNSGLDHAPWVGLGRGHVVARALSRSLSDPALCQQPASTAHALSHHRCPNKARACGQDMWCPSNCQVALFPTDTGDEAITKLAETASFSFPSRKSEGAFRVSPV